MGIETDPDNKEKYSTDLIAAKRDEAEIEEQIEEQFPDLYTKYHKGSGGPKRLQLNADGRYLILRIQNHTKYTLSPCWKTLWETDCWWGDTWDYHISPYDVSGSDYVVRFGIAGAPEGKIRYWIDGTDGGYFELHFWKGWAQDWLRGSCDVYNTNGFDTDSNTWSDGGDKAWREFHIRENHTPASDVEGEGTIPGTTIPVGGNRFTRHFG